MGENRDAVMETDMFLPFVLVGHFIYRVCWCNSETSAQTIRTVVVVVAVVAYYFLPGIVLGYRIKQHECDMFATKIFRNQKHNHPSWDCTSALTIHVCIHRAAFLGLALAESPSSACRHVAHNKHTITIMRMGI